MSSLRKLLLSLATVVAMASPPPAFAGKPGSGGTTPTLPAVRYYTTFVSMPAGSVGHYSNAMNNRAQFVGWYYGTNIPQSGVLFDPMRDVNQAIDLNSLVTAGLQPGWRIRSGVDINDWGVVVGTVEDDLGVVRAFAMDVEADFPVVDLLPDIGSSLSAGVQINENGDIVGYFTDTQGAVQYYAFNPGYYGAPPDRLPRVAGVPLDFSQETPSSLPTSSSMPVLNNPVVGGAAQVAGTVPGTSTPFRYTLGDATDEQFPELSLYSGVNGLNDHGTFCGAIRVAAKRGKTEVVPFRFNNSVDGPGTLSSSLGSAWHINSSDDLVLSSKNIYRDDWGAVNLNDLVVGPAAGQFIASTTDVLFMNDRGGETNSAQFIKHDAVGLFLLTPIPAP